MVKTGVHEQRARRPPFRRANSVISAFENICIVYAQYKFYIYYYYYYYYTIISVNVLVLLNVQNC